MKVAADASGVSWTLPFQRTPPEAKRLSPKTPVLAGCPWCLPDLASLKGGDAGLQAFRKIADDAKRHLTQRIILYRD
jgi:hypothetical protein